MRISASTSGGQAKLRLSRGRDASYLAPPRIDPAAERDYEFASLRFSRSEIRLVCPWHLGVFSRVPLAAFSTNQFHPAGGIAHIRQGCGPWRREDAFILDRELELQVFGRIVRVPDPLDGVMLRCVPFEPLFRGLVIKQPISFDDMQSLRVCRLRNGPRNRRTRTGSPEQDEADSSARNGPDDCSHTV